MLPPEVEEFVEENPLATRRYHALVIVGIILPFLLVPFLSLVFYQKGDSYTYLFVVSRFIIWAALGLMFVYARYAEVQKFLLWGEEEYNWTFYLLWIVVLYVLCFSSQIVSAIPYLLGLREKSPSMQRLQHLMKLYPYFGMFTALTAGITEELVFRGYMMSRLAIFFKNKHYPVLISAALFCSIHISYHYWGEIIFTFLLGLIFGYHYQRFRNIKVLIVVHFIVDAVATIAAMHHK
jgi:membrane protease YdiL (CAAX protease family)